MAGEGGKGQGCWRWLGGGPGCQTERPERRAETLLRLLAEPPPLSRLSPPPPVPPLPKPRKAVQVSSCAFAFPSRCPPQVPRAALTTTPGSGHGHTEGPSRSPSQGERCGFEWGVEALERRGSEQTRALGSPLPCPPHLSGGWGGSAP